MRVDFQIFASVLLYQSSKWNTDPIFQQSLNVFSDITAGGILSKTQYIYQALGGVLLGLAVFSFCAALIKKKGLIYMVRGFQS